jgi:hypothetical protein
MCHHIRRPKLESTSTWCYPSFILVMIRSPGFGSIKSDYKRPIQTRFRLGSGFYTLTKTTSYKSPAHSSTGTRSGSLTLPLLVSKRFHVLFHSPTGVLFTFPSQYYFAIGHPGIFSLTRWSSLIHTGFHVSHATRDISSKLPFLKPLAYSEAWESLLPAEGIFF